MRILKFVFIIIIIIIIIIHLHGLGPAGCSDSKMGKLWTWTTESKFTILLGVAT
jgi:hypothetical protein